MQPGSCHGLRVPLEIWVDAANEVDAVRTSSAECVVFTLKYKGRCSSASQVVPRLGVIDVLGN